MAAGAVSLKNLTKREEVRKLEKELIKLNIELSYINFMHIAYVRSPTNFGRKILDKCNCNTCILSLNMNSICTYINYYDILTGIQIKGKKIIHICEF